MPNRTLTVSLISAFILVVLGLSSIYIVDPREKALVLQFGQIKAVKEEPGLGFKIPLIQEVVRYDSRILPLDTDTIEVTPSDDRRLVVDTFALWRIRDLTQFRRAVGVGGIQTGSDRLESILIAQTREVLGADQVTSNTILSDERVGLMNRIRASTQAQAAALGIEVVDVRLKQTNLPQQNLQATFDRMRAERQREAEDQRARGREQAQRISAQADRTAVEITSDANRQAEITRGEADAERNRIYAEAYNQDRAFFEFFRSLQAYEASLKAGNTTLVMSPENEFFEYLKTSGADLPPVEYSSALPQGEGAAAAEAPAEGAPAADAPVEGAPAEPAPAEAAPAAATPPASPDAGSAGDDAAPAAGQED